MNNPLSRPFHGRALASVLTGFAFLILAASGAILFLSPPGRIANWTDWTIFGLRKSDWTALHVWFALLFLGGVAVHLFYNLRPLLGYFRSRVTRRAAFRREWVVAALVCSVITAGALMEARPFTSLLAWNESLKERWESPVERAPIPHAELLSLAELAESAGVDVATATSRLNARGITGFQPETVVQQIASNAGVSAQEVYATLSTAAGTPVQHAAPVGGGIGWKTLNQFCADEQIDVAAAIARLEAIGVKTTADKTLREIARDSGGRKPYELVETMRATN